MSATNGIFTSPIQLEGSLLTSASQQPGAGFLESLLRDNVTTFTQGLDKITEKGFISPDGTEIEVDVIICATGSVHTSIFGGVRPQKLHC